ncbi:MAG TPA: glycogen debranching N-terminal domain-containing protein [Chloroflexia bacterium]|jgi:glycogen debranching enzyme
MTTELLLRAFPDLLFVYRAHSLMATGRDGWIDDRLHGLQGFYHQDTRLISRYRLLVNGNPPRLDSLSTVDPYSTLGYYVCPPTAEAEDTRDALGLSEKEIDRQVVITVARFAGKGLREETEIANHGLTAARLNLTWELAADFAGLLEARSGLRQQTAPVSSQWRAEPGKWVELRFDYEHPQLQLGVILRFEADGVSFHREDSAVTCALELEPQQAQRITMSAMPVFDGEVYRPTFAAGPHGTFGKARAGEKVQPVKGTCSLHTRNSTVQLAWDRAVADLNALSLDDGDTPAEATVPAAGLPLYGNLFGRDALTIAGQSLMWSPRLAEGALRLLARYVGTKDDDFYDEQPGRVPQQVRRGPLAMLGITPWLHDYGDYAAPCAYLVLLGGYHLVTGDKERTREFMEPARRVLGWLQDRADLDGDGFLEYETRSSKGQIHQGWKDSGDAVRYADGREVEPPVAACEIQGYWYAALLLMAEVFLHMGEPSRGFGLLRDALALKRRFNEAFWMPSESFFAFALDSDKQQVTSITSNPAHCLATGIVEHKYARALVHRLMQPDMFSGWGIRTLSSQHPAYNPLRYHLGSVWPVETATAAFGMKRYGFTRECNRVVRSLFDASALFEHRRLPETLGGHQRDSRHPHPGIYPDACAPQGWSASAIFWLVQSMLGIWTYAPLNLLIVDPTLPHWLPEMTLRDLQVGQGKVSIHFKRERSGKTDYRVLERSGPIRVVRQPPPDDLGASPLTRVKELVGSVFH